MSKELKDSEEFLKKKEVDYKNEPYIVTYQQIENLVIIHKIEKIMKIEIEYKGNGEERKVETAKIYDKLERTLADEILNYVKTEVSFDDKECE